MVRYIDYGMEVLLFQQEAVHNKTTTTTNFIGSNVIETLKKILIMNFEKEIKLLQLQVSDILRKIKAKSTSWGELLGDIRNQKDLMRYFGLKQDLLKSGKNIKTINGQNILGSGNLVITGVGDYNVDGGHSDSILLEQNINGGNA